MLDSSKNSTMKRSGRTLRQRLYGLKHLGGYLRRARYFRGHGVHSPYVYSIVRQVFMQKRLRDGDHSLYEALRKLGINERRSTQLQNLLHHCDYASWAIDELRDADMLLASLDNDRLEEFARYAEQQGKTLVVMYPYNNKERWEACHRLIEAHPSTSVDNRAYLILFNNHLPRQRYRL